MQTFLRIKRKRTDDPVDALLVAKEGEDKRIKVGEARVFRLVETVSQDEDQDAISRIVKKHRQPALSKQPMLDRKQVLQTTKLVP
jgi:hypothetical protein